MAVTSDKRLEVGPATLTGLRWLASVGATPVEAWATAMGWSRSTVFSHASRLVEAGWATRTVTVRGQGSLLYATPAGVRVAGVTAVALPGAPAPTSWAHHRACAWTAAWLTARGRELLGPREMLLDDDWRGEVQWIERDGVRRRGHRPDLAGGVVGGALLPIEVELASKSLVRLRSILAWHASRITGAGSGAVIYVCGTQKVAARVKEQGAAVGLAPANKTLRVELLDRVQEQALAAREGARRSPHMFEAGVGR